MLFIYIYITFLYITYDFIPSEEGVHIGYTKMCNL